MMHTVEFIALGFAGGTTFTLMLLTGARRANAPRPRVRVHISPLRTEAPIDFARLARIEGDAAR